MVVFNAAGLEGNLIVLAFAGVAGDGVAVLLQS
jgi:hypothetical protein